MSLTRQEFYVERRGSRGTIALGLDYGTTRTVSAYVAQFSTTKAFTGCTVLFLLSV